MTTKKSSGNFVTQAEYEAMKELAYTDHMTGIPNRRAFDEALIKEMSWAQRKHTSLSLSVLDLDYFKEVNDRYGHIVGDAVLVRLSAILKKMHRVTDFIARVGGEEFAIILPGAAHIDESTTYLERLRKEIEDGLVVNIDHVSFSVTASLGVVEMIKGEKAHELYARADAALYTAKMNGRNQVVFQAISA